MKVLKIQLNCWKSTDRLQPSGDAEQCLFLSLANVFVVRHPFFPGVRFNDVELLGENS